MKTFSSPAFENFIMECCRLPEWDLRAMLKEKLTEAGFSYQEDDYRSYRKGRYQEVHNMLALRGKNPKICLVAHTDVCRDHGWKQDRMIEVKPTIKTLIHKGKEVQVIQDQECAVQVGGDDRLGVAINTWLALNTGYEMGLLFTSDEEVGNQSAQKANFSEFENFELFCQVDRGNNSGQLVNKISGVQLCNQETAQRLLKIAEEMGTPRVLVNGLMTDVLALKSANKIKAAVNMTCGYHNSFGSSSDEYIVIDEAVSTMQFVSEIIKFYDLEQSEVLNHQISLPDSFEGDYSELN